MSTMPAGSAVIVGIDHYTSGIRPLQSAANDARQLGTLLAGDHRYATTVLLNEQATREATLGALETGALRASGKDQPFLFYFAGHGVARGDGSDGPQGYLLPQDAHADDRDTWISMDRLKTALEALPSRHLLVILDCCFAGAFRWASTRDVAWDTGPLFDSQYERYLKGTAWQALTSASHDEKALDISPGRDNTRDDNVAGQHSPFAAALFRGLSGEADSARGGHQPDGVITATELFQYAFEELVPPGAPSHQTPGIWPLRPDNTGQFIFMNPAREKNTRPDPPLDDGNNPWLGLSAYSDDDARLFFGRERIVGEVLERVSDPARPRLIAIVGASGTGKSSVAKAGVLPRLDSDKWTIAASARIATEPLATLASALQELSDAPGRKLLFIDQFEELYTQCRDPQRRDAYLNALKDALDVDASLTVVLTLRSDFEPQPARHAALEGLWAEGRLVVPAFTAEELRECIEGPAQVKALYFEPAALVGTLVDEVMAMPGALPLLSFALSQMYQRARKRRRETGAIDRALTAEDYAATGGVVGALHRRATDLFDASDASVRNTIRRVFLRLLAQDGARLTRRRISRDELHFADPDEQARVDEVVRRYVDARLLVADEGNIEPAHDTLIVAWEKIVEWLSDAGPQNLIRSLWRGASEWRNSDRDEGLSWHDDPRLPLALNEVDQLNALESEFVAASEALRKRRIRRLIGGSVAVGAAVTGAAILALWQWRVALGQQNLAEERLARSQSNAMLAHAQAQADPLIKGVLVAEIARRSLPPPQRAAPIAREAVVAMADQVSVLEGMSEGSDIRRRDSNASVDYRILKGTSEFDTFAFEPRVFRNSLGRDGAGFTRYAENEKSVFGRFADGEFYYWPAPFESTLAVALGNGPRDVAADDAGYRVAVAGAQGARLLDVDPESGQVAEQRLSGEDLTSIAIAADGDLVAFGAQDGRVTLLDVATGESRFEAALDDPVTHIALDDSGSVIAAATRSGTLALWSSQDQADLPLIADCGGPIQHLDVSPGGHALAAVCANRAWLWPAATLSPGRQMDLADIDHVRFVSWPGSFAHDGLWLLGLRRGSEPVVWPVVTAAPAVDAGAVAPKAGESMVASGAATTVYDPVADQYRVLTNTDPNTVVDVGGTEDKPEVTFTVTDPTTGMSLRASVWEVSSQMPDQFYVYQDAVRRRVFALATEGNFWSGALFDFAAATNAESVQLLNGTIFHDAALSPDGELLIIVSDLMNPNIIAADPKVYRTGNLQRVARTLPGQVFVRQVRFSGDGQRIATTDCRGETYIWNRNGWNDPIVLNAAGSDAPFLCGPFKEFDQAAMYPEAWFSPDAEYVFTTRGETPAAWAVGFKTLSRQIRERTFVCFTVEQREQYFDETAAQALTAYRDCMDDLGLNN